MNIRKVTLYKGFTLLEILLSLTVIIVLMLVLVPTLQKIQQQKSVDTATQQMNSIANAASQYYNMYQIWPQNLDALDSLLGYTGMTPNPFCSVWRDQNGCTPYTMVSSASSRYFALSVTVPNTAVAMQLVKNLPVAYADGTKVTAYTTVFRGFKPPPPSGVLLSMNSYQLGGTCTYNSTSTPFSNCISSSSTSPQPYGLIDVAQSRTTSTPADTIVAGNNFSNISGIAGSYFNPTIVTCPTGTSPTMIFFPVGIWNAVGYTKNSISSTSFSLSAAHFITQSTSPTAQQLSCLVSLIGGTGDGRNIGNFLAGFGDALCLPDGARTRWPDGLNIATCGANQ